jgi:hypothetical protein
MTTAKRSTGRAWHRATVIGRDVTVTAAEVEGRPGVCAGCRRLFREHSDEELLGCAATCEETLPSEAET